MSLDSSSAMLVAVRLPHISILKWHTAYWLLILFKIKSDMITVSTTVFGTLELSVKHTDCAS